MIAITEAFPSVAAQDTLQAASLLLILDRVTPHSPPQLTLTRRLAPEIATVPAATRPGDRET
jgi:hypothetical protein